MTQEGLDEVEINSIPGVEVERKASDGIEDEEPAPSEPIEVRTKITLIR